MEGETPAVAAEQRRVAEPARYLQALEAVVEGVLRMVPMDRQVTQGLGALAATERAEVMAAALVLVAAEV